MDGVGTGNDHAKTNTPGPGVRGTRPGSEIRGT